MEIYMWILLLLVFLLSGCNKDKIVQDVIKDEEKVVIDVLQDVIEEPQKK